LTAFANYLRVLPKTLPPHTTHDNLQEGTLPTDVRPYRYPTLQVDVIENIDWEMLEATVVRPSQSS